MLRQAVSLARRIQDPLIEFAQVCSSDEDILCLKFHPLQVSRIWQAGLELERQNGTVTSSLPAVCWQEHVVKEELLNALYCEFINRVNEVGVDVNRAIAHPYSQALIQYVCGLGPRKGTHLLKVRLGWIKIGKVPIEPLHYASIIYRKTKVREVKGLVQGHSASKSQSQT